MTKIWADFNLPMPSRRTFITRSLDTFNLAANTNPACVDAVQWLLVKVSLGVHQRGRPYAGGFCEDVRKRGVSQDPG